eukprot:c7494_g1_i2.p2 GENE.c7494_g1_i2~~c7494_g1_i2.p2  ORF type:complete len:214 (-),score=59.77 c7494_g1_i2:355-996(-)
MSDPAQQQPVEGKRDIIVLVDMDGTIADFETNFLNHWKADHPTKPFLEIHERTTHYLDLEPNSPYQEAMVADVLCKPGFYEHMPVIPGALEALRELDALEGVQVKILTSPFYLSTTCEDEKRKWVERELGPGWLVGDKFMCLRYKHTVEGDFLIDDRPDPDRGITGAPWKHIVYDAHYNKHIERPRLTDWTRWREQIGELFVPQQHTNNNQES